MEYALDSKSVWIDLVGAREAMQKWTGKDVRVAVIDSGIEFDHPDLADLKRGDDLQVVESGVQLEVKSGDGRDVFGHGTAIAGIIHRLAPEVEIGSFRVLDEFNMSKTDIVREAVRQALDRNYHILNCSFGCGLANHVLKYKSWVDEAYLKGVHIVAACNNDDFRAPEWPGAFPSVITVNSGNVQAEEVYYRQGNLVEFIASGENIDVPWQGARRKLISGSSFATPHVTALLSRLVSAYPRVPPLQAKALLHQLAKPWGKETGIVDVTASK
jgi:subtilisin family serine protease